MKTSSNHGFFTIILGSIELTIKPGHSSSTKLSCSITIQLIGSAWNSIWKTNNWFSLQKCSNTFSGATITGASFDGDGVNKNLARSSGTFVILASESTWTVGIVKTA